MKVCPVCSTEYGDDVKFCPRDGQTLRSATPASDLVGQIVADRYHILKKLGEGGMGQVYRAEHVKMGRHSAIKVMNPSMVHDPAAVARFNREASNASRINHPNVCAIYDFGETSDGLIFLAMEFIEGEPLADLLERQGALPLVRATTIVLQTAEALQAAHELGIVHRDLKPGNIMLTKGRHGAETVKVVDFGIAKAIGGDETRGGEGQTVTKTGLVIGTPEFMSPEQVSGDGLDGRSDLYSLALVFYRMLSGKLPFDGTTIQETMIKRLTDEPRKLADARPDLSFPPGLQPVLDTALARMPAGRYQSVAKFAADVAAVTGLSVDRVVRPTEAETQPLEPVRAGALKKRARIRVAATVIVILAGGGTWMVLNGGNRRNPNPVDTNRVVVDTAKGVSVAPHNAGPRETAELQTGIDPSRAGEILDGLIESPPTVIVDSAAKVYFTRGVKDGDKAFAACLVAQAQKALGNRNTAVQWATRGLAINAQLTSCQNVVQGGGS